LYSLEEDDNRKVGKRGIPVGGRAKDGDMEPQSSSSSSTSSGDGRETARIPRDEK